MFKQRRMAAVTVAEALFAAEKAIDAAIASTAALAGLMPTTRQEAKLSALIGQDAIMSAISTMQALGVAREGIVTTHKHLTVAQHDIGLSSMSLAEDEFGKGPGLGMANARLTVAA
ncbi:hypothetical protein [Caulobacter segnis]|uniref:hypothetical protein n=1 Tax=Caulobacter segnis TaxID=88688 RepID=UPI001CBC45FF|nr:hypothetical protein [Caulobacter segnis]